MNNKKLQSFSKQKSTFVNGLTLIILFLISVGCSKEKVAIDPAYSMEINSVQSVTYKSADVEVDLQFKNLGEVKECGICLGKTVNPDINCSLFYMPYVKNGKEIINTYGLEPKTTYYVRAFAKDINGDCHYGAESKFITAERPPKPKNVDYFTITVTRQKRLLSGVYIPLMKQYKLTVLEYSKVEYKWSCSDKTVVEVVASTRAFTPVDGSPYSNSFTQTFNPSGSKLFPQWDGLPGYLQFYIRTYNSKYYYSDDYVVVQEYIEANKTYDIWSDKPYL